MLSPEFDCPDCGFPFGLTVITALFFSECGSHCLLGVKFMTVVLSS